MRIYFDACCLSRPDDDQSQERIRTETERILTLLEVCERGEHDWIASTVLFAEASSNPDPEKRANVLVRLSGAAETMDPSEQVSRRARELISAGLGATDAYHLAFAEAAGCDVLFTTDDRFMAATKRLSPPSPVAVYNPADPERTP